MGRKSKLRKVGNWDNEDRISCLPDAIICHILSFLPTKYAVATSVLSSRWKLIWTSLPNLCFDDRLCLEYKPNRASTRFENFVNRVVLLCDKSVNIDKFSLHCYKLKNLSRLEFWVSSAIMRNVREIELSIKGRHRVELPESICTSKTLEVLKLNSGFVFKIPSSGICFPSVKILHVNMLYPDNNMADRLFSICPVLEDLSITGYLQKDNSVTNVNISSSTLKRLNLILGGYGCRNDERLVVVRAPNLELLYIRDFDPVSFVMHELYSLTKVVVDITFVFNPARYVLQIFKGIANAKFLSLSKNTISSLDCTFEDIFPTFPNLTHLEMGVGDFGCRSFPVILSSMPKLEALVLDQDVYVYFGWKEPPCVPDCLLSHVKKIEIRGFKGRKNQLQLIKYLLKNSEVLNSMIIELWKMWSPEMGSKEKICEKLITFERGSKTCQVVIL